MKKLFTLFVLLFSSSVVAEDISDFQIEGISVGDSLLDHISELQIKKNIRENSYEGSDHKFYDIEIYDSPILKVYDGLQIAFLENDDKYIVQSIGGGIFFGSSIEKCHSKQDEIDKDILVMFKDIERDYSPKIIHKGYSNSTLRSIRYYFNSGAELALTCYDWDNESSNVEDYLLLSIDGAEFTNWLIDYYND